MQKPNARQSGPDPKSPARRIYGRVFDSRPEWGYAARVDMGDGHILGPEDVLEGHWNRLLAQRRTRAGALWARTVQVRVPDDISAAILVVAPELAPLTELAEEVADALPAVRPEPRFRRDLYAALEQTHRQHSAQRVLGTRPEPAPASPPRLLWPIAAVLGLILLVWLLRPHRPDA